MPTYTNWNALTIAAQADLVVYEKDIERFLGVSETYAAKLAQAKDELLGYVLQRKLDPERFKAASAAQLKRLHAYIAIRMIYEDETREVDDTFDHKRRLWKEKVEREVEFTFDTRGVDYDLDKSGTIEASSVEEQYRPIAWQGVIRS